VSLTVNAAAGERFSVMLIPHTMAMTTLDSVRAGQKVNLEVDVLARYVARLLDVGRDGQDAGGNAKDAALLATLKRAGFA
jgi:riboflavin synthase